MPSRIRVVLMTGTLERGGAEGQLVALARGLDASRFDVRVCGLTAGGPLETHLREAGIPVDVIGWQGFVRSRGLGVLAGLTGLLRVVLRLARYLRRHRPHVVQGQLFWAYVLGGLAAPLARVPVVIGCRRSLPLFKAGNPRHLWIEQLANRMTTAVVCNSERVRQQTLRDERLQPERVVTIPNGVHMPRGPAEPAAAVPWEALGLGSGDEVVLCVANLIHYKGHLDLLEAWERVRRERPTAWLLLAGEGPEREAIEARASRLDGVRLLGARADVAGLLRASTLLVLPSHQEGLPNAVLEAMAAGLPVVATDVGGTSELVVDGETGRLVAPHDPAALAGALLSLLRDNQARQVMGRAAAERARTRFSLEAMVRSYERLYAGLLARAFD